jgi:hypothetical protein
VAANELARDDLVITLPLSSLKAGSISPDQGASDQTPLAWEGSVTERASCVTPGSA